MGRPARHPGHRGRPVPDPRRRRTDLNPPDGAQEGAQERARERALQGARPSPNIWHHPETYELENRAFDPDGLVLEAMRSIRDWAGLTVLDIGCGTGFHLPVFARSARRVYGVEPHRDLAAVAARRSRRLDHVSVLTGLAEALPIPPASIDVAHARWAYFLGPGCDPGLAELDRVMRRGGVAFVIDNDAERSTFGSWFERGFPGAAVDPAFWTSRGWSRERILTSWRFERRADLEAVVRIELPREVAEQVVAEHEGTGVDYAVNLWWRRW